MGFLERVGINRRRGAPARPQLPEGYAHGKAIVDALKGRELLDFLAAELRFKGSDPSAYMREAPPIELPWYYEVDLRWDVRRTEPGRYAFSDSESKKVSVKGGYRAWGASGKIDVYYYLPREGDPNHSNPVNVDTDLAQQRDLPKRLEEYSLEEKVRHAMRKTSHRVDMYAGKFNVELWNKVTRMV